MCLTMHIARVLIMFCQIFFIKGFQLMKLRVVYSWRFDMSENAYGQWSLNICLSNVHIDRGKRRQTNAILRIPNICVSSKIENGQLISYSANPEQIFLRFQLKFLSVFLYKNHILKTSPVSFHILYIRWRLKR